MKTFDQLIRLHRHRLHERQKSLSQLEARSADLTRSAERLESEALGEEAHAEEAPMGPSSFALYFETVKSRRKALEKERALLDREVISARAALKTAFEALKRIEILRDRKRAEAALAERKAEQAELDEVAKTQHARR